MTKKYIIEQLRNRGYKANYKNVLCAAYLYGDLDYIVLIQKGSDIIRLYDKDWR